MSQKELYDITIIGGGTTGLFAAFYSSMRDMKVKLIEANSELGGKVLQFFPEKLIYDVGGFPNISGDELVEKMKEQANQHQPKIILNELIEEINRQEEGHFQLTSKEGKEHYSKTILLATGMGNFTINGPEFNEDWLSSIHHSISHLEKYDGKNVFISSNNRVGIDWALALEPIANAVFLVNPNQDFQHASKEELKKLQQSTVEIRTETSISELIGSDGKVDQVIIEDNQGKKEELAVEDIFVYHGVQLNPIPTPKWGVESDKGRIIVDQFMVTSQAGMFAAGDAVIYPGKTMLIASGYSEVVTAINSAKKYIEPKASSQVYSTILYRNKN
ncbi:NAD(P)/FAD-dependent oxidoreductase [Aquibacillus kalidii]|uniref:NAD(P)/FAD-dependent oxidoreductase n=1 Tax=Aquibacillus kalidii TaxID=2762597 RepID=UPI001648CB6F|nr:NAD(P)/FAD-dependent oxidoreductase [Aquibacillus kalidii]